MAKVYKILSATGDNKLHGVAESVYLLEPDSAYLYLPDIADGKEPIQLSVVLNDRAVCDIFVIKFIVGSKHS